MGLQMPGLYRSHQLSFMQGLEKLSQCCMYQSRQLALHAGTLARMHQTWRRARQSCELQN